MIVDCDRCEVRGNACGDCVITVLLGAPPGGVELDGTDRRALDALASVGLVPRLQLVDAGERHRDAGDAVPAPSADRSSRRAERSPRQVS